MFDEIADRQLEEAWDQGEHSDHSGPPADFEVQPFLPVGRRDPFLVDLREVVEGERVLETLFQAADRIGEALPVILDEGRGRPLGALFVRLEPDLLQMGREAGLYEGLWPRCSVSIGGYFYEVLGEGKMISIVLISWQ
jgi:hypothetical protein